MLFPLVSAYLLLERRQKDALYFSLSSTAFTAIYFFRYHPNALHPTLQGSLVFPGRTMEYFLTFMGSSVPDIQIALIVGFLITLFLLAFSVRFEEPGVLRLASIWILGNALAAALLRSGFGVQQATTSRYSMYSLIGLALLYAWIVIFLDKMAKPYLNRIVTVALLVSVSFFSVILVNQQLIKFQERDNALHVSGLIAYKTYKNSALLALPHEGQARTLLKQSRELGTYDFVQVGYEYIIKPVEITNAPTETGQLITTLDNEQIFFRGCALIPGTNSSGSKISILLKSEKHIFQLPTFVSFRPEVAQICGKDYLAEHSAFDVFLSQYLLPSGSYQAGIMVEASGQTAFAWQDVWVDVP